MKAKERRIIFIDDILTLQAEVREKRINDFKKFIGNGYRKEIDPIQVMEFKNNSTKYLLRDGNHRLRTYWELKEYVVEVIVLDNSNEPTTENEVGQHISEIKISKKITKEDKEKEKWRKKNSFFF